jgi:hypothetical protein
MPGAAGGAGIEQAEAALVRGVQPARTFAK